MQLPSQFGSIKKSNLTSQFPVFHYGKKIAQEKAQEALNVQMLKIYIHEPGSICMKPDVLYFVFDPREQHGRFIVPGNMTKIP